MTAWNPADVSANITLSPDNRVAITTSGTAAAVRSTTAKTSGSKTYFEVVAVVSTNTGYGIVPASAALGSIYGSSLGFQVFSSGSVFFNGATQSIPLGAFANGDIACFAIDLVNARGWVRRNGGNWNNSGTANPATNTGGINISALFPTNDAYAFGSFFAQGNSSRCTFGSSGFEFAVPSGFSSWDAFVAGPDLRNAGTPRETLYTIIPSLQVTGVTREVLLAGGTALTVTAVAREVLLFEPPLVVAGQTAVTINTG